MKKGFLSLLLVFSMLTAMMTVPSYALSNEDVCSSNKIARNAVFTIHEEHPGIWGHKSTTHSPSIQALNSTDVKTVQVYSDEQFDGIYRTSDGLSFQQIENDVFVPVKEVQASLGDYAACTALEQYKLPPEVMEAILSASKYVRQLDNSDASVSIFISDIPAKIKTKAGVSEPNTMAMTSTTWNGYTFHNYAFYFTKLPTGWITIVKGSDTLAATLDYVKDLVLWAGDEMLGGPISLFLSGVSCLDAWINADKPPIYYGNAQNKVQTKITFDLFCKYTYLWDGFADNLGCCSQRVLIREVDTDSFFYTSKGGDTRSDEIKPNKVFETPNYAHPEEYAFTFQGSIWIEKAIVKIPILESETITIDLSSFMPAYKWPSGWPEL